MDIVSTWDVAIERYMICGQSSANEFLTATINSKFLSSASINDK